MKSYKFKFTWVIIFPLSACVNPNDGSIADKHPITFERPLPANAPKRDVLKASLIKEFREGYHEGSSIKDIKVGPVRYAKILIPFPDVDYFTCVTYTQKNKFGSYQAPKHALFTYRDYNDGRGFVPAVRKDEDKGAWQQYCE